MGRPRTWTDEMAEEARKRANAGQSASEIAVALSAMAGREITRDAVTGRAERYGIALQCRQGGFSDLWAGDAGRIATEMCREGAWPAKVRDAIRDQRGIAVTVDAVRRYGKRNGLVFGEYVRPAAPLKPKPKAVKARKPPKVAAPELSPVDPPFLPPVKLVREYVPTGRNAVPFIESAEFVCKVFLPGEPVTAAGLVCGNPVVNPAGYRFCAACSETLFTRTKAPQRSTFVTLGKRKAAA